MGFGLWFFVCLFGGWIFVGGGGGWGVVGGRGLLLFCVLVSFFSRSDRSIKIRIRTIFLIYFFSISVFLKYHLVVVPSELKSILPQIINWILFNFDITCDRT